VSSVLAMLFLVLFSTLAVGFYAAVNTSVQIAHNETQGRRAFLAAESGMEFLRYQLSNIAIPQGTKPEDMWSVVCTQLKNQMDKTGNLNGGMLNPIGSVIAIPQVSLDGGTTKFSGSITQDGDQLVVRVYGYCDDVSVKRGIQLTYAKAKRASAIFNYGVASKGRIVTAGSARIRGLNDATKGSVLSTDTSSTTPVDIGGKEVSGDVSISSTTGSVNYGAGVTIGGTSDASKIPDHIHTGVLPPDFPQVDTTAFKAYATTPYTGGKVLDNTYIPANTNPKFTGGATIRGVLYVEAPNNIEFRGNVDIQGVIVVANGATFDPSKNVLNFSGSVTAKAIDTLPASYGDLRKLTGSFILAPGFLTQFSGNFGTVNGSIIASQVQMTGNAGGTIIGSVVNNDPTTLTLDGSSEIDIVSTGTTNYPSGVFFGQHYTPLADTYLEVQ
jgi:hypothetical protein